MKLLIYPDVELWNFSVQAIREREDVKCIPLNRYCAKWQIGVRKILRNNRIPFWCILGRKISSAIKSLSAQDVIILADYSSLCIFYAIRQISPKNVRLAHWIWNPIKGQAIGEYQKNIPVIRFLGFHIYTFNPDDANKYDLLLKKQFYPIQYYYSSLPTLDIENDCYFVGHIKDRQKLIDEVKLMLSPFKSKFIIPERPSDTISYAENIRNVRSSSCIVEIVQSGQTGMTLRSLEAAAFRKKLITTNKSIVVEPLYNPKNIFVINVSDEKTLMDFIKSPYDSDDEKNYNCYDINEWINSF